MFTRAADSSVPGRKAAEGARALVVGKDETSRTWLRRILEGEGFDVDVAGDAADAASLAEISSVALIVTNCSEPGVGGSDGLRNRFAPEAWVLRVSREGEPDPLDLAPERLTFLFPKPFRAGDLAQTARELLRLRNAERPAPVANEPPK